MSGRKLLDQVSDVARLRYLCIRTEETYRNWIKRFIFFHGKRHPRELDAVAIRDFLTHLAVNDRVAASTQNQAFNALLFLYRQVLQYLGRYIFRVAISNSRLERVENGEVTFRYRHNRSQQLRQVKLTGEEFIRAFSSTLCHAVVPR